MTMSRDQNAQEDLGCQRLRVGSKKSAQQGRRGFWRAERIEQYVSTTKARERRWRLFSTDP